MVVNMESIRKMNEQSSNGAQRSRRNARVHRSTRASQGLTIGLLNNMAGAAFKATERQFVSLLDSASQGIPIHVSFYTLPGLSDVESGGHRFASHYAGIDSLLETKLDALIVTGREPKMKDLREEPYWDNFTRVLEWARTNTRSTVWSCLAAHAAILYMDGIDRRKSDEKHFGVFKCEHAGEHVLTRGLPAQFSVPHSRWNGVAMDDLTANGYEVLSRVAGNGVDTFIQQNESLFVFFQGHLEYEPDTLMREYRRDVGRYVRGESETYPLLPAGYFDSPTEAALAALKEKAGSCRNLELLKKATETLDHTKIEDAWRGTATQIYRNWLSLLYESKTGAGAPHPIEDEVAVLR